MATVADRTRIIIGPMIAGLADPDGPNYSARSLWPATLLRVLYARLQHNILCADIIKRDMLYYIYLILNILRTALVKNRITRVYFIPVRLHTNDI